MASKWSLDLLNKACTEVEEEKARALTEQEPKLVLETFMQQVMDEQTLSSPLRDAYRVYYGIACIALLAEVSSPSHALVTKLERIIKGILLRNKVKPRKSQLGHVYRQVAEILSYYYLQKGDMDIAIWELSVGHTMAQGSSQKPTEISQYMYAQVALNNGSAQLAANFLRQLREGTNSKFWYQAALAGEAKALRLAGQSESAVLLKGFEGMELHDGLREQALWESLMHDPSESNWNAAYDETQQKPMLAVQLAIWHYAQPNPLVHLETIKKLRKQRSFIKKSRLDQKSKLAIRAWEMLDTLYDSTVPFELRLGHAGTILEMVSKMEIEARCTTLIALQRWVMRNSQTHLGLIVEDEYRSLSLRLSQGQSFDVLNLMENVTRGRRVLQEIFQADFGGEAAEPTHSLLPGLREELKRDEDQIYEPEPMKIGA